ncbi:MAG: IclR family transcriptional regulator [Candidatus Rokubacteria bacterium]|nr:IclR family transcriptional regulator [Candidatus Rokubacteria bacterium]
MKRVPGLETAIAVLELLQRRTEPGDGLGVSELARRLRLNKGTIHAVAQTLTRHGYLVQGGDTRKYELGPRLVTLGDASRDRNHFLSVAKRYSSELVAATGQCCLLVIVLPEVGFLVVDKQLSARRVRLDVETGQVFPLTAPAIGKCYLSTLDDAGVRRLLRRHRPRAFTDQSIVDVRAYLEAVREVRARGYGVSVGEYFPWISAVAAPIYDERGAVALILALFGVSSELTGDALASHGRRVVSVAEAITRDIGGRRPEPRRVEHRVGAPRAALRPVADAKEADGVA